VHSLGAQCSRRGDGRSIEVAGFANAGHAVQEVEKRRTLGELQGITPLTIMNMSIYSCCGQCELVFILSTGHTEV
jgi:hypothetical protein